MDQIPCTAFFPSGEHFTDRRISRHGSEIRHQGKSGRTRQEAPGGPRPAEELPERPDKDPGAAHRRRPSGAAAPAPHHWHQGQAGRRTAGERAGRTEKAVLKTQYAAAPWGYGAAFLLPPPPSPSGPAGRRAPSPHRTKILELEISR